MAVIAGGGLPAGHATAHIEPAPAAAHEAPGRGVAAMWRIRGTAIDLERPVVVGVLNVTPDSFSDGGLYLDPDAAIGRARELVEGGADLIDIGAESSRPGAEPVGPGEEWRRLEPVLGAAVALGVPVSVDTTRSETAARALEAGAAVINDISALRFDPALADVVAGAGAGLVLMHMRGDPRTMQDDVEYADLVPEVRRELGASVRTAVERGCGRDTLVVDPGIGFGKSAAGSLELLARAGEITDPEAAERSGTPELANLPVLVGPSRKSFMSTVLGLPVGGREEATLAACVMALERGARLFRVHDVRAARRALDMAAAIRTAGTAPAEAETSSGE